MPLGQRHLLAAAVLGALCYLAALQLRRRDGRRRGLARFVAAAADLRQGVAARAAALPAGGNAEQLLPLSLLRSTAEAGTLALTTYSPTAVLGANGSFAARRKDRYLVTAGALAPLRRWLRSLRRVYAGPAAVLSGGAWAAMAAACAEAGAVAVEGVRSRVASSLQGNQLRLAWWLRALAEVSGAAPGAVVLITDSRDVIFQANPFGALSPALSRCRMALAHDCRRAAHADKYYIRWGAKCLPESAAALVTGPPVNGGMQCGEPAALRRLYSAAHDLALHPRNRSAAECASAGRDQHLITAAAYALGLQNCTLPNDLRRQGAVANLGTNNDIKRVMALRPEPEAGVLTLPNSSSPISIVHHVDRHPHVAAFFARVWGNVSEESNTCDMLLYVYPGFEELNAALVAAALRSLWRWGLPWRQFMAEHYVERYLSRHPCATSNASLAALFFVPALWWLLLHLTHSGPLVTALGGAAPKLLRTAVAALQRVWTSTLFRTNSHRHVVLMTSTRTWVRRTGVTALVAPPARAVTALGEAVWIAYETKGGDVRPKISRDSIHSHSSRARDVVVPYFVEHPSGVAARSAVRPPPRAPVFLSASPSTQWRQQLFAGLRLADFPPGSVMRLRAEEFGHVPEAQLPAEFMSYAAQMGAADLCPVLRGKTASSRRLYEAVAYGCVPVLVSDNFTLPKGVRWDRFIIRLPEHSAARLGEVTRAAAADAADIARRKRAMAEEAPAILYADAQGNVQPSGALAHIWSELRRLGRRR